MPSQTNLYIQLPARAQGRGPLTRPAPPGQQVAPRCWDPRGEIAGGQNRARNSARMRAAGVADGTSR